MDDGVGRLWFWDACGLKKAGFLVEPHGCLSAARLVFEFVPKIPACVYRTVPY